MVEKEIYGGFVLAELAMTSVSITPIIKKLKMELQLIDAAKAGRIDEIARLLDEGIDIDFKDCVRSFSSSTSFVTNCAMFIYVYCKRSDLLI